MFSNDFWGHPISDPESHKSYRPLTILSFRLNYWIHGLSPGGYHGVNVLVHSIVCVLVHYVLMVAGVRRNVSWLTALLFTVHPIHTEVVCTCTCTCICTHIPLCVYKYSIMIIGNKLYLQVSGKSKQNF